MKVTHIIESTGGSADFMLYLVKYLPQHSHTIIYGDRTFVAFGSKHENIKSDYPHVNFIYWKYIKREVNILKDIKASWALFEVLIKLESDVIHLHSSKAGFIGRLVCFFLRKKGNVIYTPNGLAFLRSDVPWVKVKMYLFLEQFADKLSGRIVSCCKSEADELIRNGISSSYINNGTVIFDNQQKLPDKEIVIATIGRVTAQKNPVLFNEIAGSFIKTPSVKFLWIGGGELEHVLTSKNIVITGWMERYLVLEKLRDVDIYISTALWEGLPFAVLEAMNLSKPLVLSNCTGNIDLINDNGFIYSTIEEAVEKLDRLINDPELIIKLGKNSHDMAEQHNNVEQMAKLYESEYLRK
jgi:glycosyltransferase involved in cell wall biosynthesis